VAETELRELFSREGLLARFCMSPSGTIAVVKYVESRNAAAAFKSLAFSRFKNMPLYLEWAPTDVFGEKSVDTNPEGHAVEESDTIEYETSMQTKDELEESVESVSLFVKNLSFKTTDEGLTSLFSKRPGFRKATVMKKKVPLKKSDEKTTQLSMGYGFIEFVDTESAKETMKTMQGVTLDEHCLELKISQKPTQNSAHPTNVIGPVPEINISKVHNKLVVRNLAFEATKSDLRKLFSAYGNVSLVRIPLKPDGSSRGYGFVTFLTRSDALLALEALQHTHLYGRHLIIEPAAPDNTTVEALQEKARKQFHSTSGKKRRRGLEQDDNED